MGRQWRLGRDPGRARGKRSVGRRAADDRCDHHPCASLRSRWKRGAERNALGRSRGGFSTKINARTNAEGLPIGVVITPGQAHDITAFPALMQEIDCDPEQMLGDNKGYDSEAVRNDIEERAACRVLPPALLHLIVSARARTRIGWLGVPIALEKEAEAVVAPVVAARNPDIDSRPAHQEAALGLVVEHRDELGAIVGLAAERLVRDDDGGSRQCSRRDAIEHILRDSDAVERVLGVVSVIDRYRGPAQARIVTCHRREHMRPDRLVGIADGDRSLNGRIEHLAPVRPRLMCVAPHVKLLRRAAYGVPAGVNPRPSTISSSFS